MKRFLLWLVERGPLAAALLALGIALVFLALLPPSARSNESADFEIFYAPIAHSLLAGEGFVFEGRVAHRYPPGFPVAIAAAMGGSRLFGLPEEDAIRLLGLLGFAATAAMLCRLGRRVHGPAAGLIAATAFALYPPHLFLVKQPNSELIFLPLLLVALELLWRSRQSPRALWLAFAAGLLLGLAALVRPIALLIFVPLGLFLYLYADASFSRSRRLALVLVLAGGQLLAMAPWALHLRQELGFWLPLSSGGRLSMLDGLTIAAKEDRPPPPMPARVAALMREIDARRGELRSSGEILSFLARRGVEDPSTLVLLLGLKTCRSFYATDSMRLDAYLLAMQLPFLLLAAALFVFAWRKPAAQEPWRALTVLTLLMLLYFLAMTVLVLSILRYLVPAFSLLFLLLGATTAERLRKER